VKDCERGGRDGTEGGKRGPLPSIAREREGPRERKKAEEVVRDGRKRKKKREELGPLRASVLPLPNCNLIHFSLLLFFPLGRQTFFFFRPPSSPFLYDRDAVPERFFFGRSAQLNSAGPGRSPTPKIAKFSTFAAFPRLCHEIEFVISRER